MKAMSEKKAFMVEVSRRHMEHGNQRVRLSRLKKNGFSI